MGDMPTPKYELGQSVNMKSMGVMLEDVIVTKRHIEYDLDKGPETAKFTYDLKHNANVVSPWSWGKVSEDNLDDMVFEYRYTKSRSGG